MTGVPLTVLDLVPIPAGATAAAALRASIELARRAEEFGYARYWVAEHHLNPGVAGTSPAVVLALVAGATARIRVGSGAVQLGHRTALATVEEFGLLDALHPGRLDLGLGRSGGAPPARPPADPAAPGPGPAPATNPAATASAAGSTSTESDATAGPAAAVDPGPATGAGAGAAAGGLVIPARFSFAALLDSPRFAVQKLLLNPPGAVPADYTAQVGDILALLAGTYRSPAGTPAHAVPGEGADVQVWILGSSAGESAAVAGGNGLRFAANHHVSPATVLEAVGGYRAAFRPGAVDRPYVSVSADVVVADTAAAARRAAAGYGLWVRSIRTAAGAIPFPPPAAAAAHEWTEEDRRLVADRLATQFVGTAAGVADRLDGLRAATGADELIVTTITHDPADRIRSYELLAHEWERRHPGSLHPAGSRG
ncbi:hypothetical protein GCM10010123_36290 [Pilimelia anulata]|uniref:Luciferase-like domain-containing protein n=1 Tax=Pilimelia anulata TaxID=53371 RepID=A0A8J3BDR0_9ACTN|nr:LLM class flavin-dependent oxidoreductase [Pilimelia anulata]GGK03077.1 hypothetical protein GCM10010123_36290 [Pilimelia anulata]